MKFKIHTALTACLLLNLGVTTHTSFFDDMWQGVQSTWSDVEQGAQSTWKDIEQGAQSTWNSMQEGIQSNHDKAILHLSERERTSDIEKSIIAIPLILIAKAVVAAGKKHVESQAPDQQNPNPGGPNQQAMRQQTLNAIEITEDALGSTHSLFFPCIPSAANSMREQRMADIFSKIKAQDTLAQLDVQFVIASLLHKYAAPLQKLSEQDIITLINTPELKDNQEFIDALLSRLCDTRSIEHPNVYGEMPYSPTLIAFSKKHAATYIKNNNLLHDDKFLDCENVYHDAILAQYVTKHGTARENSEIFARLLSHKHFKPLTTHALSRKFRGVNFTQAKNNLLENLKQSKRGKSVDYYHLIQAFPELEDEMCTIIANDNKISAVAIDERYEADCATVLQRINTRISGTHSV